MQYLLHDISFVPIFSNANQIVQHYFESWTHTKSHEICDNIWRYIYRHFSKKGTLSLYNDNIGHLMGALNVCVGDDTLSKHQQFYYTKGYLLNCFLRFLGLGGEMSLFVSRITMNLGFNNR